LKYFTPKELLAKPPNETTKTLEWKGDAVVEVRSADDPKGLVAVGLDVVAMTEAALIAEDAWTMALRPRLSSPGREGLALLNGTPKGKNWWYRLHQASLTDPTMEFFHFPTACRLTPEGNLERHPYGNPYIPIKEVESARRTMPDRWFRQEYLAEYISDVGAAIPNVRDQVAPAPLLPTLPLVIGVDLAKRQDATVFSVLDSGCRQVKVKRLQHSPYNEQLAELAYWITEGIPCLDGVHKPKLVVVEANGPGDPFVETLCSTLHLPVRDPKEIDGWRTSPNSIEVVPFMTTYTTKRQLIEDLVLSFEQRQITILDDDIQTNELEAFEYTILESGRVRFAAPTEEIHDDFVLALALAHWPIAKLRRNFQELATVPSGEEYDDFLGNDRTWRVGEG